MPVDPVAQSDVAVVGGGPSGLALATELKRLGVASVTVLERESVAGGVPRHCGHYPFGVHEFHRLMKGPDYARRHVADAIEAGVELRTDLTVTTLHPGGGLALTSNRGTESLSARRVALCTGAREASRAQRFIGGTRPQGVVTTGALQSFVYLEGLKPFQRPVILGTELVSFSSLLTCRHAGIYPVAMIEEADHISVRAFGRALPALLRVPVFVGTTIRRILGRETVEGVEVSDADGTLRVVEADGVICTGQFRPEAALLHESHLEIDPATGGPIVDQFGQTSDPAYFCAGNLLRPIETSTWCAREGRETAHRIASDLANDFRDQASTPIRVASDAIRYVVPQMASHGDGPAMRHLQIRLTRAVKGRLCVQVDGREIWVSRIDSRPERRVLIPMAPLLAHRTASSIEITVQET